MSSSKVKGLLKGLRYISQIFDSEKEEEIQIGLPTDVKHVAHIGWDGPSVNTPSWMNEFKSSPKSTSAPLNLNGEMQNIGQDNSMKWISEDSMRSTRQGNSRGLPELPKGSRRSSNNITDSPTREKSNKPRQSRKSSKLKDSSDESNLTEQNIQMDMVQGDGSPARNLSDIPKKSRKKKSKDISCGGESSKLRSKGQEPESPSGFVSKSNINQGPLEENEHYQRGVSEIY